MSKFANMILLFMYILFPSANLFASDGEKIYTDFYSCLAGQKSAIGGDKNKKKKDPKKNLRIASVDKCDEFVLTFSEFTSLVTHFKCQETDLCFSYYKFLESYILTRSEDFTSNISVDNIKKVSCEILDIDNRLNKFMANYIHVPNSRREFNNMVDSRYCVKDQQDFSAKEKYFKFQEKHRLTYQGSTGEMTDERAAFFTLTNSLAEFKKSFYQYSIMNL